MTAPLFACVMACLISSAGGKKTSRQSNPLTFIRAKECISAHTQLSFYNFACSNLCCPACPKSPVVLWVSSSCRPQSQKLWENHQKHWNDCNRLQAERGAWVGRNAGERCEWKISGESMRQGRWAIKKQTEGVRENIYFCYHKANNILYRHLFPCYFM